MAEVSNLSSDRRADSLAMWSAIFGLFFVLVVASSSKLLLSDEGASGAPLLGSLGFTVSLLAPFMAALAALRLKDSRMRSAVWLASGLPALGIGGLSLSSIGLFLMAVGIGLMAAWWLSRESATPLGSPRATLVSLWLLFWFGTGLAALWLRETPLCWSEYSDVAGWMATTTIKLYGSDVVDDAEGLLALVSVAVGGLGAIYLLRGGGTPVEKRLRPI